MNEKIQQNTHHENRKHYHKPRIEQVKLIPDEAVLGGCKTTSTADPGQDPCVGPGGNCVLDGS